MTNKQFLQQFGHFIEAPNGIQKLRELILQLAVQGKLVQQNSDEGIAEFHEKLPTNERIPTTWRTLNFGEYCDIQGGNQPPKSQFITTPKEGYVRLLQIRDLGDKPVPVFIPRDSTNRFCREGEILIGRYGASVGKIFWAKDGAYNVALAKFIWPESAFTPQYAFLVLKSDFFQAHLAGASRSAQAGFNKGDLAKIDFPLPPLQEQHRIVAKVDELMALCDQLEAERNAREATHQRLIRAVHHPLTEATDTTTGIDSLTAWHRIRDNFADLYTTLESVQALRQTILQLAVQGKLVAQDPSDEPAFNLIDNIKKERECRITKRASKQNKFIRGDIQDEEVPFELPSSWEWCRFGTLVDFRSELVQPNEFLDLEQIAPDSIEKGTGKLLIRRSVKESGIKGPNNRFYKGQILYSKIRPSLSKAVIAPCNGLCSADMYPLEAMIDKHFLLKVILSEVFLEQVRILENRIKMPKLNVDSLSNILVAVPPANEQHRIVTKVDELMVLCDQLETNIRAKSDTAASYAQAIVQQISAA